MIVDRRVQQLLDEIMESGRSAEEVCSDCPELLPQVRLQLLRLKRMEERVNSLFPPSGVGPGDRPIRAEPANLPRIPGYEVREILGRGGIGIVYKAWDLRLNRPVALKMLLSGVYAQTHELERFHREAEAIAALAHPNIVQVHDIGEHDGTAYFTMEFVEGGNLARKLSGSPQPARKAADLVMTFAQAIQAAHHQGIVHRDLKPANVMLTADGTPKITDFGLASRINGEAMLTQTGVPVGTPSYMSPEQAAGHVHAIGPATDIYALGAILYELLTGRPPFRAETASETERQVIAIEPAPPRRLNAKIPRDLETICLKCLQKERTERYATAADLVADLRRFLAGEPILARPAGLLERTGKWVRRRPALAVALLACAVALAALLSGVVWLASDRAATMQAVENDLQEVARLERESAWPEASTALERAKARLRYRPTVDLRHRLDAVARDLELAQRLDSIGLNRIVRVEGRYARPFDKANADAAYAAAFSEAGLGSVGDDPLIVAARINQSNIKLALITALDDWAICVTDRQRNRWLFEVTCAADPDPSGWRNRVRDPAVCADRAALMQLVQSASDAKPPVRLLVALGERLQDLDVDATSFLRQVQQQYPGDFWTNATLGTALLKSGNCAQAVRYYQAALAIRPRSAVARVNLGLALVADNDVDEAVDRFREAIRIDPDFAHAHFSLGLTLRTRGEVAQAIAELKEAARLEPRNADYHYNLALALKDQGEFDQSIERFRAALEIEPKHPDAIFNLGLAFGATGKYDRAIDQFREALKLEPFNPRAHYNLGLILKATGDFTGAIDHLRRTIEIKPRYPNAHYNLALALRAAHKTDEAVAEFANALKIDPRQADTHYNLGLALKDCGEIEQAITHFREAISLDPTYAHAHGALGESLLEKGRLHDAQASLRRCLELLSQDSPGRTQYVELLQRCDSRLAQEGDSPATSASGADKWPASR
jgi:eukaryotic-like serine/threonine-protein kinase